MISARKRRRTHGNVCSGLLSGCAALLLGTLPGASALGQAPGPGQKQGQGSASTPQRPAQAAAQRGAQLIQIQGEVRLRHAVQKEAPFEPASAPLLLQRRDEIETGAGSAEVVTERGMRIELAPGTLVAVIGAESGVDMYLARGALRLRGAPPRPGQGPAPSAQIVTAAGRLTARGQDVRVRIEGDRALVAVHEGQAGLWGKGAVILRSGQTAALVKGAAPTPPQPLQAESAAAAAAPASAPAPSWISGDALYLHGARPAKVTLRWQPVPGAVGYHVELSRTDVQARPPPIIAVDTAATEVELPAVPVGAYAARVAARMAGGQLGPAGEARRVVVLALLGLSPAGTLQAGSLPRLSTPEGTAVIVQVGGEAVRLTGLVPGTQKIQVQVGALLAEAVIEVVPGKQRTAVALGQPIHPPADRRPDPQPDQVQLAPQRLVPVPAPGPARDRADHLPAEDVLLGGPGEVPGGGVRSPWAGRVVQVGLETDAEGQGRLLLHGRGTLRSGLGGEVSFAALRFFPDSAGGERATYGNLAVTLRSPALRRARLALQGIAGATALLGPRAEDHALALSGGKAGGAGRDWLIDGAVLFGARAQPVALHTQQGVTLALSEGGVVPVYEGGVAVQAEAAGRLRVIGLSQWHAVLAGPQAGSAGGAVGGGFEVFLPAPRGGVRIQALGRAGIGAQGAAVYGRAMFGVQIGYQLR
jgi:hypothetical protein